MEDESLLGKELADAFFVRLGRLRRSPRSDSTDNNAALGGPDQTDRLVGYHDELRQVKVGPIANVQVSPASVSIPVSSDLERHMRKLFRSHRLKFVK